MDTEEWVVYSITVSGDRATHAISRKQWDMWNRASAAKKTLVDYEGKLVADGLTKERAQQLAALTHD